MHGADVWAGLKLALHPQHGYCATLKPPRSPLFAIIVGLRDPHEAIERELDEAFLVDGLANELVQRRIHVAGIAAGMEQGNLLMNSRTPPPILGSTGASPCPFEPDATDRSG